MPIRKKAKPSTKPAVKSANKTSRSARIAETAAQPYNQPPNTDTGETWISASEFKARCLELMDAVRDTHESIVITKHGIPVAKLVSFQEGFPSAVGYMRGTVLSYGDLISPIDVEWDADK